MVKKLDPSEVYHVPYERYPWDNWSDGTVRVVTHGVDFSCSIASFRTVAHAWARNHGMKLQTTVIRREDEPDQLRFKFYKQPSQKV
jgi:hypothetical protein